MRAARVLVNVALGAVLLTGGAACGGDRDKGAEGSRTSTPTPAEGEGTSPAEVAAGLRMIADLASDVADATGSDPDAARIADERIDDAWTAIEGRIRGNDAPSYVDLQDALAALGAARDSADREKAAAAAERLGSLVGSYLVRFPADGSTASPTEEPTASPSPSDF